MTRWICRGINLVFVALPLTGCEQLAGFGETPTMRCDFAAGQSGIAHGLGGNASNEPTATAGVAGSADDELANAGGFLSRVP